MTALLMRWQVIPANFVVFVIDLIFEIPRDHMLPSVKIIIINAKLVKTSRGLDHVPHLLGPVTFGINRLQAINRFELFSKLCPVLCPDE